MNRFNVIRFPHWYGGPLKQKVCEICRVEIKGNGFYYEVRWQGPFTVNKRGVTGIYCRKTCSKECADMIILQNM